MNFKFVFCSFIIINYIVVLKCEEETDTLIYVDEVVILKKLFSDLNELKTSFKNLNARLDECQGINESKNKDLPVFDIRFDALPQKCSTDHTPANCAEATSCTHRSGIYRILIRGYSKDPVLVECDVKTQDGDWIVIQRRQDGSTDFYRDWSEYRKGFGNLEGEFFIGMDKLYALTNFNGPQELLIVMKDGGLTKYAKYSTFVIGNETELFALQQLGTYSGDAGDSLTQHLGGKFSTKDRDNDDYDASCAVRYTGAWWYKKCHISNLNGKYGDITYARGLTWHTFRGYNVSIQNVKMMIRRRRS